MAEKRKRISVIIPAKNESSTLPNVLDSCKRIQPYEIVTIVNGSTDATAEIAKQFGCRVIVSKESLGNDVGRAIGARNSSGEILLFLDADFHISPNELDQFLKPIMMDQADVVLNDMDFLFHRKNRPHSTTVWRQIFNHFLNRADLKIDSILSVPHAMTRKAVQKIGYESLSNPILAHAKIIQHQLRIHHQYGIDVIKRNRYRPALHSSTENDLSPSEKRIIADHLFAFSTVLKEPRGGITDGGRRRDLVHKIHRGQLGLNILQPGWGITNSSLYKGKKLSVIIPVQNEERTIGDVILQTRKIEPIEIIVIVNGSTDSTAKLAAKLGAKTIVFDQPLGNDVGRAIGAGIAKGDILLFLDGDFTIEAKDLFPFAHAVTNGVDIALNDLNHYLHLRFPLNIVTAYKYAVNLALNRKDLGVSSLIAVPHAISRNALDHIQWSTLLSPVVTQVKGVLSGLKTASVHRVDVDKMNRIRPDQHFAVKGIPPATERIIGDHVEAIHALFTWKGPRGIFPHDGRKINLINKL